MINKVNFLYFIRNQSDFKNIKITYVSDKKFSDSQGDVDCGEIIIGDFENETDLLIISFFYEYAKLCKNQFKERLNNLSQYQQSKIYFEQAKKKMCFFHIDFTPKMQDYIEELLKKYQQKKDVRKCTPFNIVACQVQKQTHKIKCPICNHRNISLTHRLDFKLSSVKSKKVDMRNGYCFDCHQPFIVYKEYE